MGTRKLEFFRQGNFQERFEFNVWLGIADVRIIGPIIFDEPLSDARYQGFVRNGIGGYLEDLLLIWQIYCFFRRIEQLSIIVGY